MQHAERLKELALAVLDTEAKAIVNLANRIDDQFVQACQYLLSCDGRIVVIGMGKSGHIANKIAATLASTGSPAFFVHPGEASHGDLGMITRNDVVLALSNSGETQEIVTILPLIKRLGIPLIAMVGRKNSTLAKEATVFIDVSVEKEACPLGLAPTASTTAALAMGDALAISLLEARGFTAEDFAFAHPGGTLGRRLLLRVDSIMRTGQAIPRVAEDALLKDALVEMTNKGLGMTTVVNKAGDVVGIFTDGDLRRAVDKRADLHDSVIKDIMTKGGKRIRAGMLAAEVMQVMENKKITCLLVVNENDSVVGIVHMHDLLQANVA